MLLSKKIFTFLIIFLLQTNFIMILAAHSEPTFEVYLFRNNGGHVCMYSSELDVNNNIYEQCTSNGYSQNVVFDPDAADNEVRIFPANRYQFGTMSIVENCDDCTSTTVNVNSNTSPFIFTSKAGVQFNFTWDVSGNLQIPQGIPSVDINILFERIPSQIELSPTTDGSICIDQFEVLPETTECSTGDVVNLEFDSGEYQPRIFFEPEYSYLVEAITISIEDSTVQTSDLYDSGSLTVGEWEFTWENRTLKAPVDAPSFQVEATFIPRPPLISGQSGIYGEIVPGTDNGFQIHSLNEEVVNDYSEIRNLLLLITYFGVDPTNPAMTNARLFCRFEIDTWVTEDDETYGEDGLIYVWMPSIREISVNCPNFHVTTSTANAQILFFDIDDFSVDVTAINRAVHQVPLSIPSAPGLINESGSGNVQYADEIVLEVSNSDELDHVQIEIESDRLVDGGCSFSAEYVLNETDELQMQIPSFSRFNTLCTGSFLNGYTSLDRSINHEVFIKGLNSHSDHEQYVQLTLQASPEPTPPIVFTPQINLPIPESTKLENSEIVLEKNEKNDKGTNTDILVLKDKEEDKILEKQKIDYSWCEKKGIWIHTKSNKLRLCNPDIEFAIEIPACAGKKNTPTYPWIFRANRFIPGESDSKSGVTLHNAVFFYKGLAISGSNEVKDKPCSKGSVFIPMEYSKTVYDFAKSNKPLIWVRED